MRQLDGVLLWPPRDVISIAVALVDLKRRSVGQLPRLTFHFAVELRSLRTPCRIQNQKSAGRIEQSPKRLKQDVLLCLRDMTQKESDQRQIMGMRCETVF